mgnify:CR=1 FL=1
MEKIKGTVTKVRNTSQVSGGGRDGHVSTSHISMFQIDKQQVKVKSAEPPMIDENDFVAVAGKIKNGVFNAYAYKNATTGVSGNAGILIYFLFGLLLPGAGVFALTTFSEPFFGILPKILGPIFIIVGLFMLYHGTQVLKAKNLLITDN